MKTDQVGARHMVSRAALTFGLLGGAVAWAVHLTSAYLLAEWGCKTRLAHWHYAEVSAIAWLILAATVVTTLIAAAATWVAYRADRKLGTDERGGTDTPAPRAHLARTGMITSAMFTAVILIETIPVFFFLDEC